MDIQESFNNLSMRTTNKLKNFSVKINDQKTEFVITNFNNCLSILITQYGKIGNLYEIKVDQPESGLEVADPVYTVNCLLGPDNLEAEVGARYITEKLKIVRPLLLSLTLKDFSKETLHALVEAIVNYKQ